MSQSYGIGIAALTALNKLLVFQTPDSPKTRCATIRLRWAWKAPFGPRLSVDITFRALATVRSASAQRAQKQPPSRGVDAALKCQTWSRWTPKKA